MLALWLEQRRLELKEVQRPAPAQDEALVRVLQAGICNTDLELVKGYYPFAGVLGHEFVGVVEDGLEELRGQRVVGEINAVCGDCDACRSGRRSHCANRTVLGIVAHDGAFAEYLTLPVENLHRVPDSVSDDQATLVEPLAAAFEIQEQLEIMADDRVLVVGDGKLGQLIARTLVLTGAQVTVVGRHQHKLEPLRRLGVRCLMPISNESGTDVLDTDRPDGTDFDIAVECTGNPTGFATALAALRPRGTLVMKSTYAGDLTVDAAQIVVNEITLVGSRCGPFERALEALATRTVIVDDLIEARYPLSEALAAFEHAARRGIRKIMIDIAQDRSRA